MFEKKSDVGQNGTMHHQNEVVMTTPVHLYDALCHSVTHLIFNIPQYRACCMYEGRSSITRKISVT